MAFSLSQGSLFAVLLRSAWWYSALTGLFIIAISAAIADSQYVALGVFAALPFFGIAAYAGYKQSQQPRQKRVLEVSQLARKMPAVQIAEKIADGYTQVRFESSAFKGDAAELELTRGHQKILLCTRRLKVANTGIESLKKLVAAGENADATGYLYVALGEISDTAREYARQNNIELIQAARLAAFFDGKAGIE